MTIPVEQARTVIERFQNRQVQNLFAQSHAKHVLYEVNESPDNFPNFDRELDDKVTVAAYALLAAGCSLLEQQVITEGMQGLENAAALLIYAHGPFIGNSRESSFHALVSAMAFYAAGHYSRAFVAIRQIEDITDIAGLVAAYIRKDTAALIFRLNSILLQNIPDFDDQISSDQWIMSTAVARSIAYISEYTYTGYQDLFDLAIQTLDAALVIAVTGLSPSHWWIVRLLKLMFKKFEDASLWKALPPFFDTDSNKYLTQYISSLALSNPPVTELWASQITSLPLALNTSNLGGVINLRTSAGKTRVAEMAILQTLSTNPHARVIYLAPFRSLAFELEHTLSSFESLGFRVSHLYGGSRVSSVDTELLNDSSIIIATPEKVRSLFRAYPESSANVKLIIVDEGHLIGPSERYIKNELFIDHLRFFIQSTKARMLLLSAVLPNPHELAEWVTGNSEEVATSKWKPSAERFGYLRWNGRKVRIDWIGKAESFNPSFVEAKPLGFGRRRKHFPDDKNEAIAATAVRLASIGPVMIFSGKATSVPTLAKATMLALGENPIVHHWPQHEWRVFESVCAEELEEEAIELKAARVGIICHSNRLSPQVRLATEHLMRSCTPKIIIATTTLGQGVNIGISSVIVASPYIGRETVSKRDFWNICGRAGRAFIDGEGKILYAIDELVTKERTQWQIENDTKLARGYFEAVSSDRVESGLLFVINRLRKIAENAGVSFEVLLELVSNNDFNALGDQKVEFEDYLDLLDDELLAMHEDAALEITDGASLDWVEQVFRCSLAAIQARSGISQSSADDVVSFLRARTTSILRKIPDKIVRKSIVASGLPLSIAIKAHENLDFFRTLIDGYLQSEMTLACLIMAVQKIEFWARINAVSMIGTMDDDDELNSLREKWLGGTGLRLILRESENAALICKDLYGYQLPWLIHAISQKLDKSMDEERINALSCIALLVEIGVPTELAAKIFLSGVRSRVAATELAQLDIQYGSTIYSITDNLRNPEFVEILMPQVSEPTQNWLNLVVSSGARLKHSMPHFAHFRLEKPIESTTLYARTFEEQIYLCTVDGLTKLPVKSDNNLPFHHVVDNPRYVFVQNDNVWELKDRNSRRIQH
jgi:hypothetical protein